MQLAQLPYVVLWVLSVFSVLNLGLGWNLMAKYDSYCSWRPEDLVFERFLACLGKISDSPADSQVPALSQATLLPFQYYFLYFDIGMP